MLFGDRPFQGLCTRESALLHEGDALRWKKVLHCVKTSPTIKKRRFRLSVCFARTQLWEVGLTASFSFYTTIRTSGNWVYMRTGARGIDFWRSALCWRACLFTQFDFKRVLWHKQHNITQLNTTASDKIQQTTIQSSTVTTQSQSNQIRSQLNSKTTTPNPITTVAQRNTITKHNHIQNNNKT